MKVTVEITRRLDCYEPTTEQSEGHIKATCAFLHDESSFGYIKPGTAKRRMSTVQNFYRWFKQDGKRFKYPLWLENDASRQTANLHLQLLVRNQ